MRNGDRSWFGADFAEKVQIPQIMHKGVFCEQTLLDETEQSGTGVPTAGHAPYNTHDC